MTTPKTFYRPGLRFKAHEKARGHQECCFKGAEEIRNPDGTMQKEAIRPLWAEFGVYGAEFSYVDPDTDRTETGSEFRGGFFDLDLQAEEKEWSATEKEIVARHMLTLLDKPGLAQFTLAEAPKFAPPWPTYDEMEAKFIADFAASAGLAGQALAYELQNEKRPAVVKKLRELTNPQAVEPEPVEDDELVAA